MSFTITKDDGATDWVGVVKAVFEGLGQWGWPVVAIVFLVLFRPQIGRLLDRLRRAAVGDAGVDFSDEVVRASALAGAAEEAIPHEETPVQGQSSEPEPSESDEREPEGDGERPSQRGEIGRAVDAAAPPKAIGTATTIQPLQDFAALVRWSPSLAVMSRYRVIEEALTELESALRINQVIHPSLIYGSSYAAVLSPSVVLLVDQLKKLGDAAKAGSAVTDEDAMAFFFSSKTAERAIRNAIRSLGIEDDNWPPTRSGMG